MKKIVLLCAAALAVAPANADRHLVPEDAAIAGQYDNYEGVLLTAKEFEAVLAPQVRARVIFNRSQVGLYAVGIGWHENKYVAKPDWFLWSWEEDGTVPVGEKNPPLSTLKRCERALDRALAEKLVAVWKGVVFETRVEPEHTDYNLDEHFAIIEWERTYHFSVMRDDVGESGGRTAGYFEPQYEGRVDKPQLLVGIVDKLEAWCPSGDRKLRAQIETDVDALAAALRQKP
jgi:hypothetical protein